MKSLKRIFISFTIFMLIVIVIFFNLSKANVNSKRDLVFYNDQLHQVEQAISEGMTEEDIEAKYSCYIIMAKEIDDVELSELYASGALVLDLNVDGDYVGKVAWNDTLDKVRTISAKADSVSSLMRDVMHANLEEMEKIDIHVSEESTVILEERIKSLSDLGNIILENHIYPCLVYMDSRRMEQVIENIIGNSAKYAVTDIRVHFSETEDMMMEGGMEYYNDNGFFVELLLRKV